MGTRGGAYFFPSDAESGPDEEDGQEGDEQPGVPRWQSWLARGGVVIGLAAVFLVLPSVSFSAYSVHPQEPPPMYAADFPRLWSWRSIITHLGIPWYDSDFGGSEPEGLRGDAGANASANRSSGPAGDAPGARRGDGRGGGRGGERQGAAEGPGPARRPAAESGEAPDRGRGRAEGPGAAGGENATGGGGEGRGAGAEEGGREEGHGSGGRAGRARPHAPRGTPPPLSQCREVKLGMLNGVPICPDQRSCLCIVDRFLQQQPRGPLGLLQTRAGSLGGGPCGDNCDLPHAHKRCDTYDNSLAVIYYTKRRNLAEAKKILDVFTQLLYPFDPSVVDPKVLYDPPSGRKMTLLATAYSPSAKTWAGHYRGVGVAEGTVDTGNNAWAALAFAHFAAAANASCYAVVARDILYALKMGGSCSDKLQGFLGRMAPTKYNYRSAEHNIDVLALARMLGETDIMEQASHFVRQMYMADGPFAHSYRMGEISCRPAPPPGPHMPVPADAIYWGLLAGADPDRRHLSASLAFALGDSPQPRQPPPLAAAAPAAAVERLDACCAPGAALACCPNNCCGPGSTLKCCGRRLAAAGTGLWEEDVDIVWNGGGRPVLNGTRFTTDGHGVQWEVSAGAGMALVYYKLKYGVHNEHHAQRLREVRDSLRHLLAMYKGVPASILGGNYDAYAVNDHSARYPGGTDTGIFFTYLRYRHVASTAWTGLLMLYQADDDAPVFEDANPFAPPSEPMPSEMDKSCLPWLKEDMTTTDPPAAVQGASI